MDRLSMHPNLLKNSAIWRLNHILDNDISQDTREQWIYEIKENLEEIIRFKFSYLGIKTREDFLDLIKNVSKGKEENDLFNVFNIGFYYLGTPLLNLEKYFDISKKN